MTGLIVALDDRDLSRCEALAKSLRERVAAVKVGLTLFGAHGPAAIEAVGRHAPVFCDLKLHDIPEQVSRMAEVLATYGVWMLTVHASGGSAMVTAAVEGAGQANPETMVAGVTVLTSLTGVDLASVGQVSDPGDQVARLGRLALDAGATALVCSGHEVSRLRAGLGAHDVPIVVPGVRPAGSEPADQARVMTPGQAAAAGADFIVVGRPIAESADPVEATEAILADLGATAP